MGNIVNFNLGMDLLDPQMVPDTIQAAQQMAPDALEAVQHMAPEKLQALHDRLKSVEQMAPDTLKGVQQLGNNIGDDFRSSVRNIFESASSDRPSFTPFLHENSSNLLKAELGLILGEGLATGSYLTNKAVRDGKAEKKAAELAQKAKMLNKQNKMVSAGLLAGSAGLGGLVGANIPKKDSNEQNNFSYIDNVSRFNYDALALLQDPLAPVHDAIDTYNNIVHGIGTAGELAAGGAIGTGSVMAYNAGKHTRQGFNNYRDTFSTLRRLRRIESRKPTTLAKARKLNKNRQVSSITEAAEAAEDNKKVVEALKEKPKAEALADANRQNKAISAGILAGSAGLGGLIGSIVPEQEKVKEDNFSYLTKPIASFMYESFLDPSTLANDFTTAADWASEHEEALKNLGIGGAIGASTKLGKNVIDRFSNQRRRAARIVRQIREKQLMDELYEPPYIPDYNPNIIEKARDGVVDKTKNAIRKTRDTVRNTTKGAVDRITNRNSYEDDTNFSYINKPMTLF